MKRNNIRFLFLLTIGVLLTGCSKDEFYDIEAADPSNITLSFSIADDDSGLLTVYPQAQGATYFHVFFGDVANETPTRVQAGQKASNIYAEGDYKMKVIAFGLNGGSVEKEQDVMIRFTPPENLVVDIQIDPKDSKKVRVTPRADNATLFEIFWGDVPDEEPTTIMAGETAQHAYAEIGTYEIKVIARSASSTTLMYTETVEIVKNFQPLRLPLTFESDDFNYAFVNFGNVTTTRVDNPDPSGINTSGKVAQSVKPANAEVWGGSFLELAEPIDFSKSQVFQVKVWAPKSGITVKLKVENATDGNIAQEVDVVNTVANAWENLTFDFSGKDLSNPLHKVVLFFDFGNNGQDAAYYFDDVVLGQDVLGLPLNFESSSLTYSFVDFGNAFTSVVANPDRTGANTSAVVAKTLKAPGAEIWAGSFIELPAPIDFSQGDMFRVRVWSPKSGITVKLKLENATDGNIAEEVDVVNTVADAWEILTFDFSDKNLTNDYHKVVIFFDFGNNGDGSEYYFDNIELTEGGGAEMLGLPVNFESSSLAYEFVSFGNAFASVVPNPDKSGANTSNTVAQMEKKAGAEVWAGAFLELPNAIDFSKGKIFQVKTWSPKSGATVRLKLENATDGNVFLELDATTTTTNAWETLSWDFSEMDTDKALHKVVLFFDFGNNGDGSFYYFDDISQTNGGGEPDVLQLPVNFESSTLTYDFVSFGNAFASVIANPDQSGANTSATVVQMEKKAGAEVWAGAFLQLPNAIDFSKGKTLRVKTWSPKAGATVRLKLENATDGNVFLELDATTTTANSWETLSWDFSAMDTNKALHKVVLFFDFGNNGDGSFYYFDDIEQRN